jgi:hypothetical protein
MEAEFDREWQETYQNLQQTVRGHFHEMQEQIAMQLDDKNGEVLIQATAALDESCDIDECADPVRERPVARLHSAAIERFLVSNPSSKACLGCGDPANQAVYRVCGRCTDPRESAPERFKDFLDADGADSVDEAINDNEANGAGEAAGAGADAAGNFINVMKFKNAAKVDGGDNADDADDTDNADEADNADDADDADDTDDADEADDADDTDDADNADESGEAPKTDSSETPSEDETEIIANTNFELPCDLALEENGTDDDDEDDEDDDDDEDDEDDDDDEDDISQGGGEDDGQAEYAVATPGPSTPFANLALFDGARIDAAGEPANKRPKERAREMPEDQYTPALNPSRFALIVKEIQEHAATTELDFAAEAVGALHQSAEQFVSEMFGDAQKIEEVRGGPAVSRPSLQLAAQFAQKRAESHRVRGTHH